MNGEFFAKVFNFVGGQVLLTRENRERGNNPYVLRLDTIIGGVRVSSTGSFLLEEERDDEFECYDQERALVFYNDMRKSIVGE